MNEIDIHYDNQTNATNNADQDGCSSYLKPLTETKEHHIRYQVIKVQDQSLMRWATTMTKR